MHGDAAFHCDDVQKNPCNRLCICKHRTACHYAKQSLESVGFELLGPDIEGLES